MTASTFHSLRVIDVRRDTDEAVVLTFCVPPELAGLYRFRHGQYLTLRRSIAGEDVRRSYSICSPAPDGPLRVAVKRITGGVFSSWVNDALEPGMALDVLPPEGRFTSDLDPGSTRRYVAVAAGSGITPIVSVVATVLGAEPRSTVTLLYGNRTAAGAMLVEEIDDLKARYRDRLQVWHVFSRDVAVLELANGRLDPPRCRALIEAGVLPCDADAYFLCGPGGMIEGVGATLATAGIPGARIHAERFTPGTPATRPAAAATDVRLPVVSVATARLNGRATRFDVREGETVLDAGLADRPELPYSCRAGVCATCRARVVEGAVTMEVSYGLEEAEIDAGFVLTCQAVPRTPTVEVDYDA